MVEARVTPDEARARLDQIGSPAPGTDPGGGTIRREAALLNAYLGNVAMLAGDYETGRDRYREALRHDPGLLVARLNLATALLDLGRQVEAEEELRSILADDPGHARALELKGEAAFRGGRTEEAIASWERSLAIQPKESLAARLARARRLNGAEEGFHRLDSARFSMKFDGEMASQKLAAEILGLLEESYADLAGRLAHYPDAVIQVTLYSRRSFHEATESPAEVGGLFDGHIRVPIGGLERLTPRARRVLVHELTHSFVASKSRGTAPQWIHEGLAQVVEGRTAASDRPSLAEDWGGRGVTSAREFSYPRALSQVEFFLTTWSGSHLNDLLDRLARGSDIESAMRAVTGSSFEEFLEAWGGRLQR